MSKISIYSGNITDINKYHREIKEDCGLFIGPLFCGSRKNRVLYRSNFIDNNDGFCVPVYHIYSPDEFFVLKNQKSIPNYQILDSLDCTKNIEKNKIIGISGKPTIDKYNNINKKYPYEYLTHIADKENWCNILCFNSLVVDSDTKFSLEIYQMIYKLKPQLIVIGGTKKLQTFLFPTTNIKTVLLGENNYLVYDTNTDALLRKL